MTNKIMRKLRLAFVLPPKPPVKKPRTSCPHCGRSTKVITEDDMERRRERVNNYKF